MTMMEQMQGVKSYLMAVVMCALLPSVATACSFAPGYFHQVTALRGRVVGKDLGLLQFSWLRQSLSVSNAELVLYEYRYAAKIDELKRAASTRTDSDGKFDFGALPKGQYSLKINVNGSEVDWFDVDVTDVKPTQSVLIDVSPVSPDCTGGHELIEKKNKNAASH